MEQNNKVGKLRTWAACCEKCQRPVLKIENNDPGFAPEDLRLRCPFCEQMLLFREEH